MAGGPPAPRLSSASDGREPMRGSAQPVFNGKSDRYTRSSIRPSRGNADLQPAGPICELRPCAVAHGADDHSHAMQVGITMRRIHPRRGSDEGATAVESALTI